MPKRQSQWVNNFSQTIKKFFLSAFVVFAFAAYAIHQRLTSADATQTTSPASSVVATQPSNASSQTAYKNGTYTGPSIDAFYGPVEVQATVQNGKLASVQFLQYPNDRMTSVQINTIAMPYLQQEAIQTQSANVDIISGATLTSEGFMMSLQAALASAK